MNLRGLAKAIEQLHCLEVAARKAEADLFKAAVAGLGGSFHPGHTLCLASLLEDEILFEFIAAGEQCRRRTADRLASLADGDLLQLGVVNPDLFSVANHKLRIGFLDFTAQLDWG